MPQEEDRSNSTAYYERVALVPDGAWTDLDFIRAPGAPTEPEQMRRFRMAVQSTCRVIIQFLNSDPQQRKDFLLRLHKTADLGLRGVDYNLDGGYSNLDDIRKRLVDHAYGIRDSVMIKYRNVVLIVAIPLGLVGMCIYLLYIGGHYIPAPSNGEF